MRQPQAVIRDRAGTVHRVLCLHRHAHSEDPSTTECSVWEVKTGTETAFDIQILLDGAARRAWTHHNPNVPFCPGAELPDPVGARRFSGAIGVVEAVLHATELDRNSRVVVDSRGRISLGRGARPVALRDASGRALRIELSLPAGSRRI